AHVARELSGERGLLRGQRRQRSAERAARHPDRRPEREPERREQRHRNQNEPQVWENPVFDQSPKLVSESSHAPCRSHCKSRASTKRSTFERPTEFPRSDVPVCLRTRTETCHSGSCAASPSRTRLA